MIIGSHSIIYSKDAEADRGFLRDIFGFPNVDVGHGWLIFGLPPSEIAVHPSDENDHHEFYLMCADVQALVESLHAKGIACTPIQEERWGSLIHVTLPGGGRLGIYQPKHASPPAVTGRQAKKKAAKRKPAAKRAKRKTRRKR